VQNSAWMFASSGISILIQFAFFTILARIYSPAVYGVFGIFNAYASTLGNTATFGYNQAFVLPSRKQEFSALLRLTLWIALLFSSLVTIITLLFGLQILSFFSHDELGEWIYWVGPTCFLLALDRIAGDWAIRNKEFKSQTKWSIGTTLFVKIFNMLFGMFVSASAAGLVFTTMLQHLLRVVTYSGFVIVDFRERIKERFSIAELKNVARDYKEFPLFINWGNLINIFSNNLPAAMLTPLGFSIDHVGFYTYSLIVLDLPIRMLGAGVTSVFMQKAAEMARERMHELAATTWKLYKTILAISLLFSFVVFMFGEQLYLWLLEERWGEAGRAAEVLIIFYFFRMISSPLTSLFNVLRKEKQFFLFQVMLMVFRISAMIIGAYFTNDFIELMLIYSLVNAAVYFVLCLWIFKLMQFSMLRVAIFTLGSSVLCFGAGYLLKIWMV
jgi:O-antigen/teichoic acid export membrane protein